MLLTWLLARYMSQTKRHENGALTKFGELAAKVTFQEIGGGSLVPKPCLQSVHERHRLTAGELGMIRDGFGDLLDRSRDKLRVYFSR